MNTKKKEKDGADYDALQKVLLNIHQTVLTYLKNKKDFNYQKFYDEDNIT